jgi:hypothetical protein
MRLFYVLCRDIGGILIQKRGTWLGFPAVVITTPLTCTLGYAPMLHFLCTYC